MDYVGGDLFDFMQKSQCGEIGKETFTADCVGEDFVGAFAKKSAYFQIFVGERFERVGGVAGGGIDLESFRIGNVGYAEHDFSCATVGDGVDF